MKKLSTICGFLLLSLLLVSYSPAESPRSEIKGTVVNFQTGKPIADVYLYVTEGEEEAVSNNKGEFRIITWRKKLPLLLTVEHPAYQKQEIKIVSLPSSVSVKLIKP
jgi:hypothetical protein